MRHRLFPALYTYIYTHSACAKSLLSIQVTPRYFISYFLQFFKAKPHLSSTHSSQIMCNSLTNNSKKLLLDLWPWPSRSMHKPKSLIELYPTLFTSSFYVISFQRYGHLNFLVQLRSLIIKYIVHPIRRYFLCLCASSWSLSGTFMPTNFISFYLPSKVLSVMFRTYFLRI